MYKVKVTNQKWSFQHTFSFKIRAERYLHVFLTSLGEDANNWSSTIEKI